MAEERFARDPEGDARSWSARHARRPSARSRSCATSRAGSARACSPSAASARLTALAARSPIPASVDLDVPDGLPDAVENATWFVVSEALANAGKHSRATRVVVNVGCVDDRLIVEVVDDGAGGASAAGSGLTGLRKRVEALDGTLAVSSPSGGPTAIRAELPCRS